MGYKNLSIFKEGLNKLSCCHNAIEGIEIKTTVILPLSYCNSHSFTQHPINLNALSNHLYQCQTVHHSAMGPMLGNLLGNVEYLRINKYQRLSAQS